MALIEIELLNKTTGKIVSYPFDQALNIFKQEKYLGVEFWVLPPDAKYLYHNGNFIEKRSVKPYQKAKKRERDKKGAAEKGAE